MIPLAPLVAILAALLAARAEPVALPVQPMLIDRAQIDTLRQAILESPGVADAPDPIAALAALLREDPSRSQAERDALDLRIRSDAALRRGILELSAQRVQWRSEARGTFIAWWDPRQQTSDGQPSSGLSVDDARALGDFLSTLARELAIPVPSAIPYVVDLQAGSARVRAPSRLRWGIVTPSSRDRAAVTKLLLLEVGDSAFVLEPLSALRACEDAGCRAALLDHARAVVIRSGYIPIVEGLRASAFAGEDDPAFASALLVVDRIDRLHPARTFTALLASLELATQPADLRGAFFRATGEAPGRLDTLVQVELSEWARARSRAAGR